MNDDEYAVTITPSSLNSIPIFNPRDDNARQWLSTIERHALVFRWSDADKLAIARCRLSANAQEWESTVSSGIGTWHDFCEAFRERYAVREEELFNRLANCRQGKYESVRQYADRFRH